jgi:hypothetical protein
MLTISKPLSAGQAQSYHQKEFTAKEQNYWSQHGVIAGESSRFFRVRGPWPLPTLTPISTGHKRPWSRMCSARRTASKESFAGAGKTTHGYPQRRRNARLSGQGLRTDLPRRTPTEFFSSQLWSPVTVKSLLICVQPYCILGLEGETMAGMKFFKRS